ncbi:unnamed protein product [Rhizophagus irregularis]|nr:unnamed protein product [Rhizophagus irregularis]CAB4434819.1 unnamed protein product [Rhizophagus irregularis]
MRFSQKCLFTFLTKVGIVLWSKSLLVLLRSRLINYVKLNARNVITAIGFLIANEYLIFCGITRLLIKKFFNLHILKNSRNFCDKFKRIPRAHDKLSIKFKEIAVGSKNLV